MRRVVTGHRNGKSVILDDSEISSQENPQGELAVFWGVRGIPVVPLEISDLKKPIPVHGFPQVGETSVGIFMVPSDNEVFAKYKEKGEDLADNWRRYFADDPFMHTTNSVDFDIVLSGELWMELDDGVEVHLKPGDCVIQNGTRHAWRNHGSEKCFVVGCIVGAKRSADNSQSNQVGNIMSLEGNKVVVRSLYEALSRRELSKMPEMFTQGYVEHYPGMDLSREQADEGGYMFANAFPDVVSTIEDMIAEGDKVAIRVTHRGTHKGMYMGIPATGKKVEITNTCIFRVAGGKLAECWATPDGRLMQQLRIKA